MEFSVIILTSLFLIVIALFAFCLTEPRGKNTPHARKNDHQTVSFKQSQNGVKKDPISQSYNVNYTIKNSKTEAA